MAPNALVAAALNPTYNAMQRPHQASVLQWRMNTLPTRLPSLFISHGSPMIALEPREAGHFLQRLGPAIEARFGKPRAILIASAHSLAREPTLLAAPQHHAVYDFGGFDPRLNQMRYDAPGAPALAKRVHTLLNEAGMANHVLNEAGLDHGIWTALRYLWPAADVPVLPLAWSPHDSPTQLWQLGQVLAPLADEGVLIIGSGSITHNLRRVFSSRSLHPQPDAPATPESTAFRDWFAARVQAADRPALCHYRALAPHAALMHPTDEHLLPFFIAAGAGGSNKGQRIHASLTFGDLGMDTYAFGTLASELSAV
jgi:4,5-DOPA dioxygenase extradiol